MQWLRTATLATICSLALASATLIPAQAKFAKIADFKQVTVVKNTSIPPVSKGDYVHYYSTISAPSAIPAGSLVCLFQYGSADYDTGFTVTDSAGNTYVGYYAGPPTDEPGAVCSIFYCVLTYPLPSGGKITETGGYGQLEALAAVAWSGVNISSPVDTGTTTYVKPNSVAGPYALGPTLQNYAPDLFVSAFDAFDPGAISVESPWTAATSEPGGEGYLGYHEFDTIAATGHPSPPGYSCPFYTADIPSELAGVTIAFKGQ